MTQLYHQNYLKKSYFSVLVLIVDCFVTLVIKFHEQVATQNTN